MGVATFVYTPFRDFGRSRGQGGSARDQRPEPTNIYISVNASHVFLLFYTFLFGSCISFLLISSSLYILGFLSLF